MLLGSHWYSPWAHRLTLIPGINTSMFSSNHFCWNVSCFSKDFRALGYILCFLDSRPRLRGRRVWGYWDRFNQDWEFINSIWNMHCHNIQLRFASLFRLAHELFWNVHFTFAKRMTKFQLIFQKKIQCWQVKILRWQKLKNQILFNSYPPENGSE